MATFTAQLTIITQKVTKPAFAPSVVVEISSPEPTIDADRIKPGPRYFSFPKKVVGAGLAASAVNMYGSVFKLLLISYWMLDAGCWLLVAGCWMLVTGYSLFDTMYYNL